MKIFILTLYLFSGAQTVESVIQVTGYEGGSAVIRCPYYRGYERYSKYLCRGSCPRVGGKDIPIRIEGGQTKAINGRLTLHDDIIARVFTVTITGLTAQDSGQYWCGVKTGFGKTDIYIEVELRVSKAQVVTKRPEVVTTTEVTEGPTTATEAPSTTTFGITNTSQAPLDSPIENQHATVSFNVLVSGFSAGIVALMMILSVVLGCYTAKRKKRLQHAELPLSTPFGGHTNTCSETGTTREVCSAPWRSMPEIDPVYEGLSLKQCGPTEEYGRLGTLPCAGGPPLTGATGWSCPGNEYDTLRCTRKGGNDEYDTLGCARKGGNDEYDTLGCTRKGAENEYDILGCTRKGGEDEYDTLGCTRKVGENEYDILGCTRKVAENECEAEKSALNSEYECMTMGRK